MNAISQDVLMNLIHNMFKDYTDKMTDTSPRAQWVMLFGHGTYLHPMVNRVSIVS